MRLGGTAFGNTRPLTRDAKLGFHATVVSSTYTGVPTGTETEMLRRGNTVTILDYIPYSKQTSVATDARPPHDNEQETGKPSEFFESLQFPKQRLGGMRPVQNAASQVSCRRLSQQRKCFFIEPALERAKLLAAVASKHHPHFRRH